MVAISGSVAPTSARRVTAVPRKSLKVRPATPAALHAFPHDARKPSDVHGLPSLFVRMIRAALRCGVQCGLEWGTNFYHDVCRFCPALV